MKKFLTALLTLALVLSFAPLALAETVIDPREDRGITLQEVGVNDMQEGISPTTGLALDEMEAMEGFAGMAVTGRYMPMLVQIDNTDGGVNARSPWGAAYADIIYETPLYSTGNTRLSFLFSDLIPDSVGPVRSARLGHVWLREEWDAGFLFYGQQEYEKTNAKAELSRWKVNGKGLAFSGIVSETKPWKKYYNRRADLASPHDVDANVAAMYALIKEDFEPRNHTFLFTDELPQGEQVSQVRINTGHPTYSSMLEYDADNGLFYRYMGEELTPYVDQDTEEQLGFANVIIQFTKVDWYGSDAPVAYHVGQKYFNGKGSYEAGGNADFFMGGVRVKGYWQRKDMESRTVFYTEDGQELELQRGKTLIVVVDDAKWQVSYQ